MAQASYPPPSATTATVTKWQLGARLASHRHTAGDYSHCTPRRPGHPGARSPNGLAVQMARANGLADRRRSRVPGPPRPLQTGCPSPRRRASAVPVRARAPTAGRHGPRGAWSAAAWGRGEPPAPRETWLLVLVRRRRGHQSPRCDLRERLQKVGAWGWTLGREVPRNDVLQKTFYLKKQKNKNPAKQQTKESI